MVKYTSGGYYSPAIVGSVDKVFAFSEVEMFGSRAYTIVGEGLLSNIYG